MRLVSILLSLVIASGSVAEAQGAKIYRADANAYSPLPLTEYDITTNTWTSRALLPANNTTSLASDGTQVYCLPEDGNIYRFDPVANSWLLVRAGPAAALGRQAISMFETDGTNWIWGRDGQSTLWYASGMGAWTSVTTPRTISSGSDIDLGTGIVFIRTYSQLGFFSFDPATGTFPATCDAGGSVSENSRVGALVTSTFFTRESASSLRAVATGGGCAVVDTLVPLSTTHSSSADDGVRIFLNGYSSTEGLFELYDTSTASATALASAPIYGGNAHPALAFVGNTGGPALLDVVAVSTAPTSVAQGDTGILVQVEVDNPGLDDATTLAVTLTFTGTADRTGEYTVTPAPANPTVIPAGSSVMWDFAVDVSPTATLETITIDASATAVDAFGGGALSDPAATTTDSWNVLYTCFAPTCGDCDGDTITTILDALVAAQHAAALITLAGVDFSNCNVIGALEPDPAAIVSILDALTLAQAAAGLPVALVCC